MLGNPRLLIVDEPTAGLDPGERNRFYSLLSEIGEDVIVILSTHIVEDVMELCTNMAIIHQGKVLFAGAPSEAVKALDGRIWQKSVAKAEVKDYEQTLSRHLQQADCGQAPRSTSIPPRTRGTDSPR